ncbi:GNAT family N-acetyltransferase [Paenibacillus filicis]|uniref:GNAT family N-acetyltransferase n=1 Tax=Paenibacillus filicis TaxID=669464 RepID=A0ABU9DS16_9BACL
MPSLHLAEYNQKSTLRNLIELYKYDFSEFDPEDVNESGRYEYMYLDHYWTEEGRYPYFIREEGALAGFVLVREIGTINEIPVYSIAEFFVMRKYRGRGIGRHAAFELFDSFRGIWKVAQVEANKPAQIFWRKTIEQYTGNQFQEVREDDWEGPIQLFSTAME